MQLNIINPINITGTIGLLLIVVLLSACDSSSGSGSSSSSSPPVVSDPSPSNDCSGTSIVTIESMVLGSLSANNVENFIFYKPDSTSSWSSRSNLLLSRLGTITTRSLSCDSVYDFLVVQVVSGSTTTTVCGTASNVRITEENQDVTISSLRTSACPSTLPSVVIPLPSTYTIDSTFTLDSSCTTAEIPSGSQVSARVFQLTGSSAVGLGTSSTYVERMSSLRTFTFPATRSTTISGFTCDRDSYICLGVNVGSISIGGVGTDNSEASAGFCGSDICSNAAPASFTLSC